MKIIFRSKRGHLFLNEEKSQLEHSEDVHLIDGHFKQRMTKETHNEFINMSKSHGDIGNFILLHPELYTFPKQLLYNERKKINRELNSIDYLISTMEKNSLFRTKIMKGDDDTIVQCVSINKVIAKSYYCDVLIVDDTVGVVGFNYPVEIVSCKDENGHLQLLGFGLIPSKTCDSFTDFFKAFKELMELERIEGGISERFGEIIVCDRLAAQTNGILNVFNDSKIIYCREHVKRNILNHYGNNLIVQLCNNMLEQRTIQSEQQFRLSFEKLPKRNFKSLLKDHFIYFLPSYVDKLFHREILSSNYAESTFNTINNFC